MMINNNNMGQQGNPRSLAQKHYLNQAEYIFDGKTQIIQHILHYENLQEEFDALVKKYNLSYIKLPSKAESGVYTNNKQIKYNYNKGKRNNGGGKQQLDADAFMDKYGLNVRRQKKVVNFDQRLTYHNLDKESVAIINRFAKDDFELLGYQMVNGFDDGVCYSLDAEN